MIKKILVVFSLLLFAFASYSQTVNVQNVSVTGRFNSCSGSNTPAVTLSLVAGTGVSIQNGNISCIDPCGTTTLRVNINNVRWNQSPGQEWLHGLFFPINAGYTLSGINLPPGFITYNAGCTGLCPAGTPAGPGFYFDGTGNNVCCGTIAANDGIPCNNYGDVSINCSTPFSFFFDLTFCNSILTGSSETFTLTGTSDGATGCWSTNNSIAGTISFSVNTSPCPTLIPAPFTFAPIKTTCSANNVPNYTVDITGGCSNNNTVSWWTAATGGTQLGTGSPFTYDPAGSACPVGDTLYASCCPNGSTNCFARTPVIVTGVCNNLQMASVHLASFTCNGLGKIDSTKVINANGAVSFNIMPGNINNALGSFSNLSGGSYVITATDAGGCKVSTTVTISPTPIVQITNINSTPATCVPGNDGTLTVTATGGTAPYQYNVGGGNQNSNSFTNLSSGSYTVTVTDANGCTATTSVNLAPSNAPVFSGVTKNSPSCNGGNNGSMQMAVSGGTMPFSFNLMPGNFTNANGLFSNVTAGNYTVTVTDANNCSATTIVNITNPALLVWGNITINQVSCNGANNGSAQLNALGGTGTKTYVLNPGSISNTSGTFSNLAPATYTVTATDANNCSITTNVTITQPTALQWNNLVANNANCNGTNTGSISITASGGTPNIIYRRQPGNITNSSGTFNNLGQGTYTITATDSKNCSITTVVNITQPTTLMVTNVTVVNPTCQPGNDGSITVTASGGTPAYQYNVGGPNQSSNTFQNLGIGGYTITVTDANGCTATSIVNLAPPNAPFINTATSVGVVCNGNTNGSLQVTAGGGLAPFSYTLVPGNITNGTGSYTGLGAGTYTVTATDAANCTINTTLVISTPAPLVFGNSMITHATCNGANNGSVQLNMNGGTAPFTHVLNPGNLSNQTGLFSNLAPGTYTVTTTDANNCSVGTSISITQPPVLQWSSVNAVQVKCNGANNGTISAVATGGTSPIFYNILPGNINSNLGNFSNLGPGTYTITASDANNCTLATTVIISQPNALQITNVALTTPSCVPGNDGVITVTATGGTTAYQYRIGGPYQNGNVFSSLTSGTYTVTVRDANNCLATSVVNLASLNAPVITNVTSSSASCNGGTNGSLQINASSSSQPLSYNLMPGNLTNTTGSYASLTAGNYTVTVTDANNCTANTVVSITQPPALSWTSVNKTNVNCNGGNSGSLQVVTSGGTGGITYVRTPGTISNSTGIFNNLTANTYTITATDANNCSLNTTVTITQPSVLQLSNMQVTNVGCFAGNDGAVSITASGGTPSLNFTLNPGNITNTTGSFTGLLQGAYSITVTDANNCSVSTSLTVTQPTLLQISNIIIDTPSCVPGNDGKITVTASGGIPPYTYSNGGPNQISNVFSNLNIGTYAIAVTDSNGCKDAALVTIAPPNAPTISSASANNVSCNGGNNGSLQVLTTGGVLPMSFNLTPGNISNGSGSFTNLSANTYTVVASDASNCTVSTTLLITQPAPLIWDSVLKMNVSCNGGSDGQLQVSASGGTGQINYVIAPGNATNTSGGFTNLSQGVYTITATDANNCSISTSMTISQPLPIQWAMPILTAASCNGANDGIISVVVNGGTPNYSYNLLPLNLTNTNGNFSNLNAGTYTITVTDANNCSANTNVVISQPTPLVITNVAITAPSCVPGNDGMLTVSASGGTTAYQYNIGGANQSSNMFNNVGSGNYTITVTDANNCTATTSVNVVPPNAPNITSASSVHVSCNAGNNGSIQIIANGAATPLSYTLTPGAISNATGSFMNLTANNYSITVTDANGCTVSTSVTITAPTPVVWDSVTKSNVSCNAGNNGTIQTAASGGTGLITYVLNPGAVSNTTGNYSNLVQGTYTITATDANNCSISTTLNITQPPVLVWGMTSQTNVSCNGGNNGSIGLNLSGGSPAYSFNLMPGNVNNTSGNYTNLPQGTYTITATDANNCMLSTTVTISQPPVLQITNVGSTSPSCVPGNDGSITVTAAGGTTAYQYNIGGANQNNNVFNNIGSGLYTVTVTDANACLATSTVNVVPPNAPIITNVQAVNVSCNAGANGSLQVNANGGAAPLSYNLVPGNLSNSTGTFTGLSANSYAVSVTDAIGCSASTTLSITEPTQVVWDSVTKSNVSCNAGNNGTIQTAASGGTGLITYVLNPGAVSNTTGNYSNLVQGTYTITATDANNCSISTTLNISQPPVLAWGTTSQTNVSCNGGNNGSINVNVSGGTPVYNFNLTPGNINNSTGSYTALSQGTYTIIATDANNCTISTSVFISQPPLLQLTNMATATPSCVPGNDGSITITSVGGTPTYQYNIGGANQSSNVFNNLGSGLYTVTVTDANNCTASSIVNIVSPNTPTITNVQSSAATCAPGNDATIIVTANNGQPSYQYNIGGANQSSNTFNNIGVGTYTITVTDAVGCTGTSLTTIINFANPTIDSVLTTTASCIPGCDATAILNASGGANPVFTYSINSTNFQNSNTFNGLCTNTYTAIVQDGNGCRDTASFVISTANGPVLASAITDSVNCNGGSDGSISVSANGGLAPLSYNLLPLNLTNATGSFAGLAQGNYTVAVSDANGCTLSTTLVVAEPFVVQFDSVSGSSSLCSGSSNGSIFVSNTGGTGSFSYIINPNAIFTPPGTFSGLLGNTTYTITATDANACSITTSIFIASPAALVINAATTTPVTCQGANNGGVQIAALGGTVPYSFNLMPNNLTNTSGNFNGLSGGTYVITVTDANNCTVSTSVAVFEPTALQVASLAIQNVTCFGDGDGAIQISGSGGVHPLSYNLQPTNQTNPTGSYANLGPANYTVTISDANNCTLVTTVSVLEPNLFVVDSLGIKNVSCAGANDAEITVFTNGGNGGNSYLLQPLNLSNFTGFWNGLSPQQYFITVTDTNNCIASDSVLIIEPLPLLATHTKTDVLCNGFNTGEIIVTPSGGTPAYTYTLTPGNLTNVTGVFAQLFSGLYSVTVTDANNCTTIINGINISQPPPIQITSLSKLDVACFGDSSGKIFITAAGGTGALQFSLMPSGGVQTSSGVFESLYAGAYTVTITDANNCTLSTVIEITQNPEIIFDSLIIITPLCYGDDNGSVRFQVSGGIGDLLYSFDGSPFTKKDEYLNLKAGSYSLQIMDSLNCVKDTTILLTEPDPLEFTAINTSTISCNDANSDGSAVILAQGGVGYYTFYIRPGIAFNRTGIFKELAQGMYTIKIVDTNQCVIDSSFAIGVNQNQMIADITQKDLPCQGTGIEGEAEVNITGGNLPINYLWNTDPIQTTPRAVNLRFGYHIVTVTDALGCEIKDTVYINPGDCCTELFFPNSFTPNGDGRNDVFRVLTTAGIKLQQFEIFNRWGQRVWQTYNYIDTWDGTIHGEKAAAATYYYVFKYTCDTDKKEYIQKGDITILR